MTYDFLVVGAGIFGATFARVAADAGRSVLVVDRRGHVGGNCFSEEIEGVEVHRYGPHIFHTSDERVWAFVNRFARFNNFVNSPRARVDGRIFSFPLNLLTMHQLWGVTTPDEARRKLDEVRVPCAAPRNMEEWLLSQVGPEIYELFFRGYTKKQWGTEPRELPAGTARRLPFRLTFDDNYYRDRRQGIPEDGYGELFRRMLEGIDVELGCDYLERREELRPRARRVLYTGAVDEFHGRALGPLRYRSLRFESRVFDGDFQGNAVVNYPSPDVPFTRIVEHKHFARPDAPRTVVTWEFPADCAPGDEPFYPLGGAADRALYERYRALPADVVFGGRLGLYEYLDMDRAAARALDLAKELLA